MSRGRRRTGFEIGGLLLGIVGLFGVGPAMIVYNFWVGVAIETVGAVLFAGTLSLWFHRPLHRLLSVAATTAFYGVALWVVWIPASVSITPITGDGNYPVGTDVNGISWRPQYSELAVLIANIGSHDMTDIDLSVATDKFIVGAGVASGIDTCTSEAAMPGNQLIGNITTSYKDKNGNRVQIPFSQKNNPLASSLYRVRCARLSAGNVLEIKFPLQSREPFDPKTPATWALLDIALTAGFRPVHWTAQKCFDAPCNDMPSDISKVPLDIGPSEWEWRDAPNSTPGLASPNIIVVPSDH